MIFRFLFLKSRKCRQEIRSSGYIALLLYLLLAIYFLYKSIKVNTNYTPLTVNNVVLANEEEKIILRKLFKRADTTADDKLSEKELAWSINRQVQQHIKSALKENFKHFFKLDKINHNGQVEWDEYYKVYFSQVDLNRRDIKEKLSAAKASWYEAARSNPDALNIDEFLSFTHPESSHSLISLSSEEMMLRYDENGDEKITLKEFLSQLDNPDEISEKRSEFKEFIDENKDGVVTKREILTYLDPKASHWSTIDARNIITSMDDNTNGFLDWSECINHANIIMNSKFVSPGKVFHKSINSDN